MLLVKKYIYWGCILFYLAYDPLFYSSYCALALRRHKGLSSWQKQHRHLEQSWGRLSTTWQMNLEALQRMYRDNAIVQPAIMMAVPTCSLCHEIETLKVGNEPKIKWELRAEVLR